MRQRDSGLVPARGKLEFQCNDATCQNPTQVSLATHTGSFQLVRSLGGLCVRRPNCARHSANRSCYDRFHVLIGRCPCGPADWFTFELRRQRIRTPVSVAVAVLPLICAWRTRVRLVLRHGELPPRFGRGRIRTRGKSVSQNRATLNGATASFNVAELRCNKSLSRQIWWEMQDNGECGQPGRHRHPCLKVDQPFNAACSRSRKGCCASFSLLPASGIEKNSTRSIS